MSLIETLSSQTQIRRDAAKILFQCKVLVPNHASVKNRKKIRQFKKMINGQMTTRSFIGKEKGQEILEKHLINKFVFEKCKLSPDIRREFPIKRPVWTIMLFHMANYFTKKGQMSMNIADLSNLYQLPEDCLTKAGILEDDIWIFSHDLSRRIPSADGQNYLEVFVLEYPNGN